MTVNIDSTEIHQKLDAQCKKILEHINSKSFLTNESISFEKLKAIPLIFTDTDKLSLDKELSSICESIEKQEEEQKQEEQEKPVLITKYTTKLDIKKDTSIKLKMLTKFIEYCIETEIEPTEPELTKFLDNIFVFDDLFRFTVILKEINQKNIHTVIEKVARILYPKINDRPIDIRRTTEDEDEDVFKHIKVKNTMCKKLDNSEENIYYGINIQLPIEITQFKINLEIQIHTFDTLINSKKNHLNYKKYGRLKLRDNLEKYKLLDIPKIMNKFDEAGIIYENITKSETVESLENNMRANLVSITNFPTLPLYPCETTIKKGGGRKSRKRKSRKKKSRKSKSRKSKSRKKKSRKKM